MDYKDLEDGYAGITQAFPPPEYVTVVVRHKMKPADKDFGMNLFKQGVAHIMIATSVIEVGVDVPNASIMVIGAPSSSDCRSCTSCAGVSDAAANSRTAF